jgi:hypothetical protein
VVEALAPHDQGAEEGENHGRDRDHARRPTAPPQRPHQGQQDEGGEGKPENREGQPDENAQG